MCVCVCVCVCVCARIVEKFLRNHKHIPAFLSFIFSESHLRNPGSNILSLFFFL